MDDSVDKLVRQWAARAPAATAVTAADGTLSYAALVRAADRFAGRLGQLGVGPEVTVALCLPRSAALVVSALGVLGAGGGYVALDPQHPIERLRAIVLDSAATVLVTEQGSDGWQLPDSVRLIRSEELMAGGPINRAGAGGSVATHPDQLAYVIYTSGSTGTPKGVPVSHGGLAQLADWHRRAFALSPADRVLQLASPGFDACVWEIWASLSAGAALHLPDPDTRVDPAALQGWLLREQISIGFVPTALAERLLTLHWPETGSLRALLTGGDALGRRPPAGLPFALINNYGLSEAAVVSTSGQVRPDGAETPSIGTPIDGAEAFVVDEQLRPVPAGQPGELLIGGPGLARGYLGQPALTAARFVPDQLSGRPGARLLRTGDLVRRRPSGELEFLGRVDDQLSRNGVRVEPAEVASALLRHPAVRSAAVLPEPGGQLVACLVAAGERPGAGELDDFVTQLLPHEMIPNKYRWLAELPLTTNGKVDRAMLSSSPADSDNSASPAGREPAGELEVALVPMVADVLGLPSVAVDANFFRLGGHSLLGAQLMMKLRDRYGVQLSLRFLFANPTVEKMASGIEELLLAELAELSEAEAAEQVRRAEQ